MEHPQELVVRKAALTLGGRAVLRDVDLELARGEVVALLGASGCGKTTLLRSIAGLATLDCGSVTIGGRDVTHASAQQRGVGVVFQHYALFPNLSVLENIKFGLLAEGVDAGRRDGARRVAAAARGARGASRHAPRAPVRGPAPARRARAGPRAQALAAA